MPGDEGGAGGAAAAAEIAIGPPRTVRPAIGPLLDDISDAVAGRRHKFQSPHIGFPYVEVTVAGSQPQPMASRYHYMINLLETLRAFGGDSTSREVYEWFKQQGIARAEDLVTVQESKETRFVKEVRFARLLLFYAGLIAEDVGGRWRLTPEGWDTELDQESARLLARRSSWKVGRSKRAPDDESPASYRAVQGPTKGPKPRSWSRLVERDATGPASTYLMRFGETGIWKVGYAANITRRLANLNRHVPTELLGARWELYREHKWPDPDSAYAMEQRVLDALEPVRTAGERLRCATDVLLPAWESAKQPAIT